MYQRLVISCLFVHGERESSGAAGTMLQRWLRLRRPPHRAAAAGGATPWPRRLLGRTFVAVRRRRDQKRVCNRDRLITDINDDFNPAATTKTSERFSKLPTGPLLLLLPLLLPPPPPPPIQSSTFSPLLLLTSSPPPRSSFQLVLASIKHKAPPHKLTATRTEAPTHNSGRKQENRRHSTNS